MVRAMARQTGVEVGSPADGNLRASANATSVPQRILLVQPWDQAGGGVASVVANLGTYLRDRGHQVAVFTPDDNRSVERGCTVRGFDGYSLRLRQPTVRGRAIRSGLSFVAYLGPTLHRLAQLIRALEIDLVNIHYPIESFVHFGLIPGLLGRPLVVSIHGADLFPRGKPRPRYGWPIRRLLKGADRIVAPSRSLMADFIHQFPGLESKARYVHNGIDIPRASRKSDAGVTAQIPTILCVAAHNEKKALDVLLRAMAILRRRDRTFRVELVGDGPLRGQHERLAHELDIVDVVRFHGWRDNPEVLQMMASCDVFVLPSRAEPFGLVALEAMASGASVIASAVGGLPEFIRHNENGLLVPPEDPLALAAAVERVLDDHELRRRLAIEGPRTVHAGFRREHMGAAYERLFGELIGSGC